MPPVSSERSEGRSVVLDKTKTTLSCMNKGVAWGIVGFLGILAYPSYKTVDIQRLASQKAGEIRTTYRVPLSGTTDALKAKCEGRSYTAIDYDIPFEIHFQYDAAKELFSMESRLRKEFVEIEYERNLEKCLGIKGVEKRIVEEGILRSSGPSDYPVQYFECEQDGKASSISQHLLYLDTNADGIVDILKELAQYVDRMEVGQQSVPLDSVAFKANIGSVVEQALMERMQHPSLFFTNTIRREIQKEVKNRLDAQESYAIYLQFMAELPVEVSQYSIVRCE